MGLRASTPIQLPHPDPGFRLFPALLGAPSLYKSITGMGSLDNGADCLPSMPVEVAVLGCELHAEVTLACRTSSRGRHYLVSLLENK